MKNCVSATLEINEECISADQVVCSASTLAERLKPPQTARLNTRLTVVIHGLKNICVEVERPESQHELLRCLLVSSGVRTLIGTV